jgi:hypothetical protein
MLPFDVSRSKSLVDEYDENNDEITMPLTTTASTLPKPKTQRGGVSNRKVVPMPRIEKRNHLLSGWAVAQTSSTTEESKSRDGYNNNRTSLSTTARAALVGNHSRNIDVDDDCTMTTVVDDDCNTVTTNNKSSIHSSATAIATSTRTLINQQSIVVSSSTTASNKQHNITNAISITPLHQIPYVHGGYASAAPLFVHDVKFIAILQRLLPSAYDELNYLLFWRNGVTMKHQTVPAAAAAVAAAVVAVDNINNEEFVITDEIINKQHSSSISNIMTTTAPAAADPVKIMKWAENNPVVSAFGIWNSDAGRRRNTSTFTKNIHLHQQQQQRDSNAEDDDDGHEVDKNEEESVINIRNSTTVSYDQQQDRHHSSSTSSSSTLPKRRKYPQPEVSPPTPISYTSYISSSSIHPPRYDKPALE